MSEHAVTVPARPLPPVALWAVGLIVAAGRWWFASNRVVFHMAPDEPAMLAMARWISGETRWSLFDHSSWRPGMAVLMAPLFRFTDDPNTIMRGGLLIAAALGGIAAAQIARLAQRLTDLTPAGCALAAVAVGLAPSSLSATAFVWAEGLVTVTYLTALWALLRFYDDGRTLHGAAAVAAAAAAVVVHGRLLVIVPVVLVLVLARPLRARRWRQAGTLTAATVVGLGGAFAFAQAVTANVWDKPGRTNSVGTVLRRIPHIDDDLRSALGQTWYQLAATAGLTMIGLVAVVATALRRRTRSPLRPRDARIVLALVLPSVALSIAFMSGRTRTDHRIYGRYNDAILWPVLVIAIAWLVGLRRRSGRQRWSAVALLAVVAAGIIGAGFAVDAAMGEPLAKSIGVRPMVAGLMPLTGTSPHLHPVRTSVLAAAVLGVLVLAALAQRRGMLLAVVGGAALAFGAMRTHEALNLRLNSWNPALEVAAIDEEGIVPPGVDLAVRFVPDDDDPSLKWDDQRRRAQLYQFALPDHRFERDRGTDDDVGPYVFAPVDDPAMIRAGAKVLWRDPAAREVLWLEPSTPDTSP